MKKILLIVDIRSWAYDDAAMHWKDMFKNEYNITILYLNDYAPLKTNNIFNKNIKMIQNNYINNNADFIGVDRNSFIDKDGNFGKPIFDHNEYDGVYFFYSKALCDSRLLATPINLNKTVIAINNEKWRDDGEEFLYNNYMSGCKFIVGCNDTIMSRFQKYSKIMKVTQCVDLNVFYKKPCKKNKQFTIGWSGNWSNNIKNFSLVEKVCKLADVRLQKKRDITREQLNTWYNEEVDALICLSSSEGGPLLFLEAGACKLPIITVPVGLCNEIMKNNYNSIVCSYNESDIVKCIIDLKNNPNKRDILANNLHNEIKEKWTYEARRGEVKVMLDALVS